MLDWNLNCEATIHCQLELPLLAAQSQGDGVGELREKLSSPLQGGERPRDDATYKDWLATDGAPAPPGSDWERHVSVCISEAELMH